MRINYLTLKNFRGFADTTVEFGDYTILRGDNGAGKSSLLMALAWATTGVCRETTDNGLRWERLLSWGADIMGVKVEADIALYARQRAPKTHRLQLEGAEASKVDAVQALLYERLGAAESVLLALLDPTPLLDRDPTKQKVMISRILKPGGFEASALMKKYSVEHIASLEQIDKAIKEFKEISLRDLNRDLRNLQAKPHERPKWPRPGKTAEGIRNAHGLAEQRRDELNAKIGGLEQQVASLQAELAIAKKGAGMALSAKQAAELDAEVLRLEKAVSEAEGKIFGEKALSLRIDQLSEERRRLSESMQKNLAEQLKEQGNVVPEPVECSAKPCPVLEAFHGSDAAKANAEVKARIGRLEKAYRKIDKDHKKASTAEEKAKAEHKALTEQLTTDKGALKEKSALQQAHQAGQKLEDLTSQIKAATAELDEARDGLRKINGTLTKAATAIQEIAEYERADERASAYQKDLAATTAGVREMKQLISELEKERKRMVDTKISGVERIMNGFLEPFGVGPVKFDMEKGFETAESEVDRWSDGQRRQILEAAFRVAAAKTTGLDIAVIEHFSPLTRTNDVQLFKSLKGCGCQVIQVYTADEPMEPKPEWGIRSWWISRNGEGVARAEEVFPKAA